MKKHSTLLSRDACAACLNAEAQRPNFMEIKMKIYNASRYNFA